MVLIDRGESTELMKPAANDDVGHGVAQDFRNIRDNHSFAFIKASVPGTDDQVRELPLKPKAPELVGAMLWPL
jgi:hypothetical protein